MHRLLALLNVTMEGRYCLFLPPVKTDIELVRKLVLGYNVQLTAQDGAHIKNIFIPVQITSREGAGIAQGLERRTRD